MRRREFISGTAASAALLSATSFGFGQAADAHDGEDLITLPDSKAAAAHIPRVTEPGTMRGEMLYRELGATGVQVSVIGLGGAHLGQPQVTEEEAIHLIHEGLDRGVNFLDNCWDYNEGRSEERMGKALAQGGYRQKAFVMTKIDRRTRDLAANQIDDSLRRLKVDNIDLLQHHEVLRYDDPDRIFAQDGAMEAVAAAQKAEKIRFIGFTGHKDPHIHLYMMEVARHHGFHFDTVQIAHQHHGRAFSQLRPACCARSLAPAHCRSRNEMLWQRRADEEPRACHRRPQAGRLPALFAQRAGIGAD
jgi:diketogulonate reductase-like aldo/keto reductase